MIAPAPRILAVDPGRDQSAYVLYTGGAVEECDILPNDALLAKLRTARPNGVSLVIEEIESYGMPVGRDVFETVRWTGRFAEAWPGPVTWLPRRRVKLHLCNSPRAKDGNVRQALLDRFPATGGGRTPQVGTKARPGPLYGVRADIWAALGVAVTYAEEGA